jgi:internalin A
MTKFFPAVLFLSFTVASIGNAQSIFPDKNLEAVVRTQVFEKRNTDKPLTEEDVVNISTLKGKNKGIKNLSGLEKCRSLAELDLAGNEIEDLAPIKDLKGIQSLTLSKNKIKDIKPLEGLTKLQYLELSGNQISDISPLAKLEAMRSLYLSENQIKDLAPVAGLKKLWSLYLDGNQIENLQPLSGLTGLASLDLRKNNIADIAPLKGMNRFEYLFLDNNKITDLQVLIEMAKADKAGPQRFSPFWQVYLKGNPLSDDAKKGQLEELKKLAKTVVVE